MAQLGLPAAVADNEMDAHLNRNDTARQRARRNVPATRYSPPFFMSGWEFTHLDNPGVRDRCMETMVYANAGHEPEPIIDIDEPGAAPSPTRLGQSDALRKPVTRRRAASINSIASNISKGATGIARSFSHRAASVVKHARSMRLCQPPEKPKLQISQPIPIYNTVFHDARPPFIIIPDFVAAQAPVAPPPSEDAVHLLKQSPTLTPSSVPRPMLHHDLRKASQNILPRKPIPSQQSFESSSDETIWPGHSVSGEMAFRARYAPQSRLKRQAGSADLHRISQTQNNSATSLYSHDDDDRDLKDFMASVGTPGHKARYYGHDEQDHGLASDLSLMIDTYLQGDNAIWSASKRPRV